MHRPSCHTNDGNLTPGAGYLVDPVYMETVSGRRFDPMSMGADDIDIRDIAHALALQNRYNGHTSGPISVARHSLWVAREVGVLTMHDPALMFIGLMHDASEAYLGDIIRPLKHREWARGYLEVEARVESLIAERYGFTFPYPAVIKQADNNVAGGAERTARGSWFGDWREDEAAFLSNFHTLNYTRGNK